MMRNHLAFLLQRSTSQVVLLARNVLRGSLTGKDRYARTPVYELARDMPAVTGTFQSDPPLGATFTVHQGRRYRANITLSGFQRLASNGMIADELTKYGFAQVVVTGSGATRVAEGLWTGPDTTAQIDPRLSNIIELSASAPAGL